LIAVVTAATIIASIMIATTVWPSQQGCS
jgi:hypothetical protein